jgi:hypothetical protein
VTPLALILAALTTLIAASGSTSWLDAKTLANWNTGSTQVPARPGAPDADLAAGGSCASSVRPPTSPEDRAVTGRGWSLTGPYERYGSLSVLFATASHDGMCRPDAYQGFVFVNGVLAGTVSPQLMHARTDASINSLTVYMFGSTEFAADFSRYGANDPLCCPHATTTVTYQIHSIGGKARVVPTEADTAKSPG